jgi:IS5 family transposase
MSLCHTDNPIKKVYADNGYFGKNNRDFLHLNKIADGIMTKATRGTELTQHEIDRNKAISKVRYMVEQYFGISHLHNNAFRARFTRMISNAIDALFRQMAFNLLRGTRVIKPA